MPAKRRRLFTGTLWLLKAALVIYAIGAVLSSIRLGMLVAFGPEPWPKGTQIDVSVAALVMIALAVPVFMNLLAVVRSGQAGTPFTPENGTRLRWIGIFLTAGYVAHPILVFLADSSRAPEALIASLAKGLLPVLLCFVVAHIFDIGTDLREDLEGTV
ncbi:MAG: DUF2975 domain-containing protein [Asticcacaulis sp.]|uniref:DUF2975 domain-containing protein n=1 Tax=Asticcacaulis sp. TaxID=1872648 RepID=UPI0025BEFBA4|nr:DUF2975 domain-containing protein [Asticcacaulis sp.]MCA1935211.1 DUF2975 domain-containing protein [Asticcacaulis sp.]